MHNSYKISKDIDEQTAVETIQEIIDYIYQNTNLTYELRPIISLQINRKYETPDKLELETVDKINEIYDKEGFEGVLEYIEYKLEYGQINKKGNNLYCISTGGWSEDEYLLDALLHMLSKFRKHYVGLIAGGHFYFAKKESDFEIIDTNKLRTKFDLIGITIDDGMVKK